MDGGAVELVRNNIFCGVPSDNWDKLIRRMIGEASVETINELACGVRRVIEIEVTDDA